MSTSVSTRRLRPGRVALLGVLLAAAAGVRAQGAAPTAELARLRPFFGHYALDSEWRGERFEGTFRVGPAVRGHYVESVIAIRSDSTDRENRWLMTWDPERARYRVWRFETQAPGEHMEGTLRFENDSTAVFEFDFARDGNLFRVRWVRHADGTVELPSERQRADGTVQPFPNRTTARRLPAAVAAEPVEGFVVANGVRLHVLDFGGVGEPVVLLPGLGNTAQIWRDWGRRLAAEGFRVVALSRRAHGRSESTTRGFGLDTLVADVAGALDALGVDRAHLVGHSFAGAELTRFAALHPERVRRLVYMDAAYDRSTQGPVFTEDPIQTAPPTDADRASVEAYLAWARRSRPDLDRYWTDAVVRDYVESLVVAPDGRVRWGTPWEAYGAMVAGVSGGPPAYDGVRAPALALYSAEDEAYRLPDDATPELREAARRYEGEVLEPWRRQSAEQFRAGVPDGRVVELNAGHHLFLHRPAEVVRLVADFLRSGR